MKDFYLNAKQSRLNQGNPVVFKWCLLLAILIGASNNVAAQRMYRNVTNIFNMDMSAGVGTRIVQGDFDNDGDKDILYQNGSSAGTGFGYFRNNGNGSFTDFPNASTAGTPFAAIDFTLYGGMQMQAFGIRVFDYDGDGDEDIIDREGTTRVLKNNAGVFENVADPFGMTMTVLNRMVVGDFDNDGDPDILYQAANTPGTGFYFVRNNGGGNYNAPVSANTAGTPFAGLDFTLYGQQGLSPSFTMVVDYDGDGDVDIIDREGNNVTGISVWKNNGGTFAYAATDPFSNAAMPMATASRMHFADFDNDGDVDVLYQDNNLEGQGFNYLKNNGGGVFASTVPANHISTPFYTFDFTRGGVAGEGLQFANNGIHFMDYDNDGDIDVLDREGGAITLWQQVGVPPVITSSTPADNAINVGLNANITLVLDQLVTKNTGNIYIVRISDNTTVETIAIGSAQITGSGTTWMINPSITLAGGTDYAIRYDQGVFRNIDLVGSAVISDNTTLNFQTVTNAAPVIGNLNGDAAAYTENSSVGVLLDQGSPANATDTDSPNFNGGNLTVSITNNSFTGDILAIRNAGLLIVSGSTVNYMGSAMGTFTGGTGGSSLVVTFNNSGMATPNAVTALMRAITFAATADNASTLTRTIGYTVNDGDGGTSNVAEVTCTVVAANDPPANTVPAGYIFNEDTRLTLTGISFSDPDGGTPSATFDFYAPTGSGTFTNINVPGVAVSVYANGGNSGLTLTGTFADVNAFMLGGNMRFTPAANFNGNTLSLSIKSNDDGNTGTGGPLSTTSTIPLTINAINDAPVNAVPASISVTEDEQSPLTGISFSDVDAGANPVNVSLQFTSGLMYAANGGGVTVSGVANTLTLTGSISDINTYIAGGNVKFAAETGANVAMTVTISDNGFSGAGANLTDSDPVTLLVTAVNDAPVLTIPSLSRSTSEDVLLPLTGISVSDEDAALLYITFTATPAGHFTALPLPGINIVGNVSGTLVISGTVALLNTYLSSPRVRYNPAVNNNQAISVAVRVEDGGSSGSGGNKFDTKTISIAINAINDAPAITSVATISVLEDVVTNITGITFSDADADANTTTATFSAPSGTFTAVDGGSVTVTGSGTGTIVLSGSITNINAFIAAASLIYTPVLNSTADETMTININDGGNTGADPGGTDPLSEEATATVTLSLVAQNDAPVITAATPVNMMEDANTLLSGISISDADAGAGLLDVNFGIPAGTGTLVATNSGGVTVAGAGSNNLTLSGSAANINSFISGNKLEYRPAPNLNGNVILTLTATDNGNTGAGSPQSAVPVQVTLAISAVNDVPGIPALTHPFMVQEDELTVFPTITFSDVDAGTGEVKASFSVTGGTFNAVSGSGVTVTGSGTNSMLLEGTLADINAFSAAGGISFKTELNSIITPLFTTVRIDDKGNTGAGGNTFGSITFFTIVTAVNDAPVVTIPVAQSVNMNTNLTFNSGNGNLPVVADIDLTAGLIKVELLAANGVMTLGTTAGLTFISGDGTSDGVFEFTGTLANVNNALNGLVFTPNTNYFGAATIRITANDQGNTGTGGALNDMETIIINVLPTFPLVTNVTTSLTDGTYKLGDIIPVSITFNLPVTVTGTPQLLLETGTTDRIADYTGGSGTNTITFNYIVQSGDLAADLDYTSSSALALNSGSIKSAANLDAQLTLASPGAAASLGANKALVIDGIVPTVTLVNVPAGKTYVASQDLTFNINFSEAVTINTIGSTPSLTLQVGGSTVQASYIPGAPGNMHSFRYTVVNGDIDTDGINISSLALNGGTIRDAAGNDVLLTLNNVNPTAGILVDAVIPTVTSVDIPTSKLRKAGEVLNFTVHFTEPVNINGGTPSIPVTIGAGGKVFNLTGGAGTNALTFSYTIINGDLDRDGIAPAASISLNGATIRDAATNNANLTLVGMGATTGILVDAVLPVINIGQIFSINENSAVGTLVGTVAGNDPGSSGTLEQWTITTNVDPDGDATPAFAINAATGAITVNDAGDLNYEANTTFTLSVQVNDGVNNSVIQTITINVDNVPEPPLDINLSNLKVFENNSVNASVGSLSSTSTEPGTTFTYTLVSGAGSADNASFSITGNTLTGLPAFNFETKSNYNIRVRSTTQHNEFLEKSFVITIGDVNEVPTLDMLNDQQLCAIATDHEITLSGITAGPETAQTVTITVGSDNPGLFSTLAVSNNKLRMRFTAGSNGTALVTVTVKDDGATANNGTDQVTRTFRVNVTSIAIPTITSNNGVKISKGTFAELTATGGVSYLWDNVPGIVSGQNTATLRIRPIQNTTFRVVASNVHGCTASAQINIETADDYKVNSANILTPNGDGRNDRFIVENIDSYPNNELKIFDQSGRLIYTKRGYQNEWDGRVNGRPLEEGTCYFMLDFGPNLPKVKGFITIIRDKR